MLADGFDIAFEALGCGIEPDPTLTVDQWSEENMIIPRGIAAEYGPYRVDRTPYAREVMLALSPASKCIRVAVVGASQLLKTQVGLNWLGSTIDQSPAPFLLLEPTTTLAKRVSLRVDKTIAAVDVLRRKVAPQRSRGARNTVDTKEYIGGALTILTAGSAANLAEISVRYLWEDELDRFEGDVEGEGDPDKIAEARTSTYGANKKIYKSSSPTAEGRSRIWKWFKRGTQNRCHLPCPHCGEHHELVWDNVHWDELLTHAWMSCPHCAAVIEESDKAIMLQLYRWVPQSAGDGETESFHISALYAPLGWHSWLMLAREYVEAERAESDGDNEAMRAFVNTRLALCYSAGKETAVLDDLVARGENYAELTVPEGGLIPFGGVDVQHDRLALSIYAFGRGEEQWLVYWGEFPGQTVIAGQGAWQDLEAFIFEKSGDRLLPRGFTHASGALLRWRRMTVDCGDGGVTQDAAYSFCRKHKARGVLAGKGASERAGPKYEIFAPPKQSIDTNRRNKADKYGLLPYMIGTHKAKDLLLEARLPLCDRVKDGLVTGRGPGRIHWYSGVRSDYHVQLLAEIKIPSRTRRGLKVWDKKAGVPNEASDTLIYAYHAARSSKIHLWGPANWDAIELQMRQQDLLTVTAPLQLANEPLQATTEPLATSEIPHAQPAIAQSEPDWLGDYDKWLD